MENSLISIIVPCYNQAQYLSEALTSVFEQTFVNWECIIVNDGSTDNTEEVALKYCTLDSRYKYFKKNNGGLSSARNEGMKFACGDYIQFLDADDIILNNKFSESISKFNEIPGLHFAITDFCLCDAKNSKRYPSSLPFTDDNLNYYQVLVNWDITFSIPIHVALFKKVIFNDFRFNEELKAKEDLLMWLYIFKYFPKVFYIKKVYAIYREHKNSMCVDFYLMQKNSISSFTYIYDQIDDKFKKEFFLKTNLYWYKKLASTHDNLTSIKNSKTYRYTNFLRKVYRKIIEVY